MCACVLPVVCPRMFSASIGYLCESFAHCRRVHGSVTARTTQTSTCVFWAAGRLYRGYVSPSVDE